MLARVAPSPVSQPRRWENFSNSLGAGARSTARKRLLGGFPFLGHSLLWKPAPAPCNSSRVWA